MKVNALLLVYGTGSLITILVGVVSFRWVVRTGKVVPRWMPLAVLAGQVSLLIGQVLKLLCLRDYVDFTAWVEIIYYAAQRGILWSSLQEGFIVGGGAWLSTHFTPLAYLFAVPFSIVEHPATVLVAQFVLLCMAPVGLYLLARDQCGSRLCGLLAAAILALNPTYQYIQLYEFEMLRFSLVSLIVMIWADRTGKRWLYWLMVVVSLLIREEVALTIAFYGLASAWLTKQSRMNGLITAALAVSYFTVVTQFIMPAFRGGAAYDHVATSYFTSLGSTPAQIMGTIIASPERLIGLIGDPFKVANIAMLLLPFGFIPLLAPGMACVSLGNLGVNLLSTSGTHTSYFLYYVAPALAILAVSMVDGAQAASRWLTRRHQRLVPPEAVLSALFIGTFACSALFGPGPLSLSLWIKQYRLAPFRTQNFHFSTYLQVGRYANAKRALAVVPLGVTVSAEQCLLPLLYDRGELLVFPDVRDARYVAIDKWNPLKTGVATVPGSWDRLRTEPDFYYDPIEKNRKEWELVADSEGVRVYRRRDI